MQADLHHHKHHVSSAIVTLLVIVGTFVTWAPAAAPVANAQGLKAPATTEHYVAPNGSPSGNGSINDPWDLQTALNQPSSLLPGDIVWLRGGTYLGSFTSHLTGAPGSPPAYITLRQYPGERATLDANGSTDPTLTINGSWAVYWGFEVTNSQPVAGTANTGINNFASNSKFINLVVHDASNQGIGSWIDSQDSEIYGCIIYNNGRNFNLDHGIYTQNQTGTKRITDNIIFNNFTYGLQAYGSSSTYVRNYDIEYNTIFNNGAISPNGARSNLIIGGDAPTQNITFSNNNLYMATTAGTNARLGYGGTPNGLQMVGNYITGGAPTLSVDGWTSNVNLQSNSVVGGWYDTMYTTGGNQQGFTWDSNTYYETGQGQPPFSDNGTALDFPGWQNATGFDQQSQYHTSAPGGVRVVVRPNVYEAGRGNITVYNWAGQGTVGVDVSSILAVGSSYEVRNGEDYFAPPVLSGVYTGGVLNLPMSGLSIAQPIGLPSQPPTGPQFNTFVVLTTGSVASPTPTRQPSATQPPQPTTTATATRTRTPLASTNTPVPGTNTPVPTPTWTQVVYTATPTPGGQPSATQPPQATATDTPPTNPTNTPVPYTGTPPPAPTSTQVAATASPTSPPTRTPRPSCHPRFNDVPPDSTYYPYITALACRRIVTGYSDNNFRPGRLVTRGQLAKIVSESAGFVEDPGNQIFQDVAPDSTFYVFVQRLANHGLITGYACGRTAEERCVPPANLPYYRAGATASRGQIVKIVSTAAGFTGDPGAQLFEDLSPDSPFYTGVQRLASRGVVDGYPCGSAGAPCVPPGNRPYFRPNRMVTRGAISKIVVLTFFPGDVGP